MLVLEIEFLTGRYVSQEYDDRQSAEWPPHPARVFSALVAVHYEDPQSGEDALLEREALEWLAGQPAPSICASGAAHREVLDVYVPANDKDIGHTNVRDVARKLSDARRAAARLERSSTSDAAEQKRAKQKVSYYEDRWTELEAVLPNRRNKNARTFPSVCPDDPIVHMAWDASPTAAVRRALDGLAARVTRLGHSSSLVRLAWVETPRAPTWIPDPQGEVTLRWVEKPSPNADGNVIAATGQVAALEAAFELHRGTANRVLPFVPVNYRRCDVPRFAAVPESNVFGSDWVVFELLGRSRLPLERAVDAAVALRRAAVRRAHEELCGCDLWQDRSRPPSCAEAQDCYRKLPAVLTGHEKDCSRAQRPHVAFVALPFVGFPHADGSILGVAAILPCGLTGADRRAVLRALGGVARLTLAPGLAFEVRRVAEPRPRLRTLDPLLWVREGVVWGTVTPILLDRFPGNLRSRNADAALKAEREAESAIVEACERIGLPRPRAVSLTAPCFHGSVAAERFRRRDRRGLPPRVRVHALIDFGTRVRGPVLLGAGRYVGLGLRRPLLEGRSS